MVQVATTTGPLLAHRYAGVSSVVALSLGGGVEKRRLVPEDNLVIPFRELRRSLRFALREIVFGVEDGLISVFGLVTGVATGADSSFVVLLAGATGAVASAVSMAAGTYLSVTSERDLADRELAHEAEEIRTKPREEEREVVSFLRQRGFRNGEIAAITRHVRGSPSLLLEFMAAHELRLGRVQEIDPLTRSAWMFGADLLAALVPVVPFAFMPLGPARIVSITATAASLVGLGLVRGLMAHRSLVATTLKTLFVAALAAGAGFVIAQVVSALARVQVPPV